MILLTFGAYESLVAERTRLGSILLLGGSRARAPFRYCEEFAGVGSLEDSTGGLGIALVVVSCT